LRPLRSPLWAAERLYQLRDALLYGRHQAGWPGVHALRWQATIRALGPWVHRFPEHLGTVYRECVLSLCGSAANHASTHRQARAMLERFVDTLDWRSPRATFDQLSRGIFFAARLRQPDACLRLNRLRVAATDELPDDTKIAALQGLGESALNVQPPHAHEALDAVEAALRLQEEKARPHQNAHQLASLWHLKAQAHEALGQVDAARPLRQPGPGQG
jgi:hypothetical protein